MKRALTICSHALNAIMAIGVVVYATKIDVACLLWGAC